MAETLTQRLQRIAAEKKAAAAKLVTEVAVTEELPKQASGEAGATSESSSPDEVDLEAAKYEELRELVTENSTANLEARFALATEAISKQEVTSSTTSEHPLAMEFAELEQALLAREPEFKLMLRKVHQHLGKDPELVTMMTEEEVALIVGGLVLFANTEIVEPAKAKGVKKAVAEAKKKVISADDL